jgi:hypothetical protein
LKVRNNVVLNFALYRAALALGNSGTDQPSGLSPNSQAPRGDRERRGRRGSFNKRPCLCCGRTFRPLGRWNTRCQACRTLQDEDGVPARVFAEPRMTAIRGP